MKISEMIPESIIIQAFFSVMLMAQETTPACSTLTSCDQCSANTSCGWCITDVKCIPASLTGGTDSNQTCSDGNLAWGNCSINILQGWIALGSILAAVFLIVAGTMIYWKCKKRWIRSQTEAGSFIRMADHLSVIKNNPEARNRVKNTFR